MTINPKLALVALTSIVCCSLFSIIGTLPQFNMLMGIVARSMLLNAFPLLFRLFI